MKQTPTKMNWSVHAAAHIENWIRSARNTMHRYNVQNLTSLLSHYFEQYPIFTIFVGILIVTYSIPIIFFISFAIVTTLVTFSGMLVIQGAILGSGFIILLVALAVLTVIVVAFSIFCWIFCLILAQIYEITWMNVTLEPRFNPEHLLNNNNNTGPHEEIEE